ncbi:MAG TPA: hypothetical protein VLT36_22805 [Candidatus Dormibacteraeota bacterium]|nr:hypothetical protein [Candidatus Dormibacteraeota bacterium]
MKIVSNLVVILVSASLGLTVGYAWKGRSSSKISVQGGVDAHALETRSTKHLATYKSKNVGVRNDDSPLATKLEHELSISSNVAKWFCWMTTLEKAQPADFTRLLKLAKGNPVIWRFVVNRWVEIAPGHLFDTLATASQQSGGGRIRLIELGLILFENWPKHDPEAAIGALDKTKNVGMRDYWRVPAASAVMGNNAERGLELMSRWHIENFGPNMSAVQPWVAANPQHAAEFTLAHPAGYASESVIESVGEEWAKIDPKAALDFAMSHPGDLGSKLAATVVKGWAGQDLNGAADWLAAADESTRNRLSPVFLEAWAKRDAASALAWGEENLQGPELLQATHGVIKGTVDKDLTAAVAMVAAMDPGQARAEAAVVVAEKWLPGFNSGDTLKPEALVWLKSLDPVSVKQVLAQVTWSWSSSDAKSMASFLSAATADEVPAYTDSTVARQLARNSPADALAWAASLPETRGLTAGGDAFVEWRQSQPDAAMNWFNALPATDARRPAFFESMVRSIAYDPQGAEQFSAMSPADQTAARSVIANMSLPEEKRSRLLASFKEH